MALTPGGRKSPSTKPPPAPPPAGQQRSTRDSRQAPRSRVASFSVLRWGVLIGGLVIIADLAAQAIAQRNLGADDVNNTIGTADDIVNFVLFSILGILVVRDSGVIYMGAIAGVFAALLDAIVVAAASSMAPTPGQDQPPLDEYFVRNLAIGMLFAGVSGVVYALIQRASRGRRSG
jgi:hypothetical protein